MKEIPLPFNSTEFQDAWQECNTPDFVELKDWDLYRCKKRSTHHGLSKHSLFTIWWHMMTRCYKSYNPEYHNYGGRGIKICKEWFCDFKNFYDWSLNNGYEKGLEIDRIENNEGYAPTNCRYVTPKVNSNNKRNTVLITYDGHTRSFNEWSEVTGINVTRLRNRFYKKQPIEKVLSKQL